MLPTYFDKTDMQSPISTITSLNLSPPLGLAPMAGMTDTAFRRLVKRHGDCALVVTEMVSSEGLVRGIGRTLEYAEYTEEERPVAIQIFGGDPDRMASAARIVESMGADIVDVNMGCPVPKIAKHNAGCSLMRKPDHAARVVQAMTKAVRIPVTVKMRAGWSEEEINAPVLAERMQDVGAAALTVHGRTAKQSYSGFSDWDLIAEVASRVQIPVFGSGDCVEPEQALKRIQECSVSGVMVGRGALRNPWIFSQTAELLRGQKPRIVTAKDRGKFLLDYIGLLMRERVNEAEGFRHTAPSSSSPPESSPSGYSVARGRERWVINKLRALVSWYSKGTENGSHLRVAVNRAESVNELQDLIEEFFSEQEPCPFNSAASQR